MLIMCGVFRGVGFYAGFYAGCSLIAGSLEFGSEYCPTKTGVPAMNNRIRGKRAGLEWVGSDKPQQTLSVPEIDSWDLE